ncbi:hypothetical protein [Mycobacterium simiae]|uniref:hypothetical protein n=1 Tax=Mycobacterium simiae TaxID=1784 RepID=UPI0012DE31AB|nr:hypothetical protein [Mycobacterium simiae]
MTQRLSEKRRPSEKRRLSQKRRLDLKRRGDAQRLLSPTHGRRETNTYPQTPNTTGIIVNIPKTVLNIVFSIPLLCCPAPVPG